MANDPSVELGFRRRLLLHQKRRAFERDACLRESRALGAKEGTAAASFSFFLQRGALALDLGVLSCNGRIELGGLLRGDTAGNCTERTNPGKGKTSNLSRACPLK